MSKDIVEKTKKTAGLYFKDVKGERPFDLWRSFDPDLAKDLSLFITGKMYAREKIPHRTRQMVAVAIEHRHPAPDEMLPAAGIGVAAPGIDHLEPVVFSRFGHNP